MTTASFLISGALSKLGVIRAGDPIDPDDEPLGLRTLNTLVDSLNLPGGFAYTNTDVSAALAIGVASLTIGPAMSLATARPTRIEMGSYFRITSGSSVVDYQMFSLSEAEYNAIPVKATQGIPLWFWLDSGASTGTVYYYPVPAVAGVVHHPVQQLASAFADLTTNYVLPQGCERALLYALAMEIAPDYEVEPSVIVARTAANAMRVFERANVAIPKLKINAPGANRARGGWYLG